MLYFLCGLGWDIDFCYSNCEYHGRKNVFIDLLGRWVDDSRVADRNRRFLTNRRRDYRSNRVVNITTPTFILSANFSGVILTGRLRKVLYCFLIRLFQILKGYHRSTEQSPCSSLYLLIKGKSSFYILNAHFDLIHS